MVMFQFSSHSCKGFTLRGLFGIRHVHPPPQIENPIRTLFGLIKFHIALNPGGVHLGGVCIGTPKFGSSAVARLRI